MYMEHSYEETEPRSLIEAMVFTAKGVMEAILVFVLFR